MKARFALAALAAATTTMGLTTAAQAAAGDTLEEVVVTAQHEVSTLSKTPIAMTAVSGDSLKDQGITDPTKLGDTVPNTMLVINNGLQITIRGVTSTDNTEKGDPSAGFLLDGVYIARPYDQAASFYDVERVEVLRGPQGTLYGKNTTAGAINVLTARPKDHFESSLEGSYGAFGHTTDSAMVNMPVSDKFALRAALNYDRRDSYVERKSGVSPFALAPAIDTLSTRLSGLWNLKEGMSLFLKADYAWLKGGGDPTVPLTNFFQPQNTALPYSATNSPVYVDRGTSVQRNDPFADAWKQTANNYVRGLEAEFNWDVGPGTLTYVGSYRQSQRDEHSTLIIGGPVRATFTGKYFTNSQELRYAFGTGQRVHGQFGAYLFHERSGIAFWIYNLLGPGTRFGFPQDPTINHSKAAFGQFTVDATDVLHFTAGVRYSDEFKSRFGATALDAVGPDGVTGVGRIATFQINNASKKYKKTTWRLGAEYDAPLGLVYGNIATGFKAGGFNDGCQNTGPTDLVCLLSAGGLYYNPETVTATEAGFKLKFRDNTVNFSGAIFSYDYKDLQVSQVANVCGGPCQVTQNAAKAKVQGVELEAAVQVSGRSRLSATANYLDAHYVQYNPVGVDFSGKLLDRSPKFSGTLGYVYDQPLNNGASLEYSFLEHVSSKYYIRDAAPPTQFFQPSYHKTDLLLTYKSKGDTWMAQVYGRNLEDKLTVTTAGTGFGGSAAFQEPQSFGVRFGVNFN